MGESRLPVGSGSHVSHHTVDFRNLLLLLLLFIAVVVVVVIVSLLSLLLWRRGHQRGLGGFVPCSGSGCGDTLQGSHASHHTIIMIIIIIMIVMIIHSNNNNDSDDNSNT